MLATNYRCPAAVIEASARMVAVNRERFEKPIRAPNGVAHDLAAIAAVSSTYPRWPHAMAQLAASEDRAGRTLCFLSRTRGELTPILLALVGAAVRHTAAVPPIVEARPVLDLVVAASASDDGGHPFHVLRRLRAVRGWDRGSASGDLLSDEDHAALDALLGWTAAFRTVDAFVNAFAGARARIAALRDQAARVELATVHASKGREWETVVLIGFEAERIPNRRTLVDADDPIRAMEEERRLAYVAVTRATRRLILAFDPANPSPFLAEMGYDAAATGSRRRRRVAGSAAAAALPRAGRR
jgi:superfamily I DNA/RNA helicase